MNTTPLILYYTITKNCNLSCKHCVRFHTPNNTYAKDMNSMPLTDAKSNLIKLAAFYPEATVSITGGEPTIHLGFSEIVETALKCFKNVVLTSNGVCSPHNLEQLSQLTKNPHFYIQISLDGDQVCHDIIRGKGVFNKTLDSLRWLCQNSRKNSISVSTTVNKLNMDSMFSLADILQDVDIAKWRIAPEQIFEKESFERHIATEEWNRFVDEILRKCRFKVSVKKIFDFSLMRKSLDYKGQRHMRLNCGFGMYKLYVYPDFSVMPCTCMSHMVVGNLNHDSIDVINDRLINLRPVCLPESICNDCEYLKVCNGGCVGYSFFYQGKIGLGDIRCPKIRTNGKS